jgi:hypothetical protein
MLYRNDGSSFTEINAGLMNLRSTSAAWADFDGDGDPDLLLTGEDSDFNPQSILYRNDNGAFVAVETPFVKVSNGAVAWADYDGDGDPDVVITGSTGGGRASTLYRNDNGTFVDSGVDLIGVDFSSVAWADYDQDGDPDLLLMGRYIDGLGQGYDSAGTTRLYRNDNDTLVDSEVDLADLEDGSAAWGDYDGDGDLDLILMGVSFNSFSPTTNQITYLTDTVLYRNDNGTLTQASSDITDLGDGDVSWSDYDSDGDLDFFIMGTRGGVSNSDTFEPLSVLYQNKGGSPSDFSPFEGVGYPFVDVRGGSVTWADYDRDGDPDLLLTGADNADLPNSQIYRNGPCAGGSVFDVPDGDVQGLINAIHAANSASTQEAARSVAAPVVVNLATNGNYTLTAPDNSFGGGNGLPVITGTVTLNGNGSTIARSSADGIPDFRLLAISGTLTLDSVIVSNGHLTGTTYPNWVGGAIFNSGVLSITNSTVQSSTNRWGGGIGNGYGGVLYLHNSTVQNNRSSDINGGGLINLGQATIDQSVISNNVAESFGGGIANQEGGTLTVTNSTITGNRVEVDDGGGIYNRNSTTTVMSSTISLNSTPNIEFGSGAGIANSGSRGGSATMSIQHSQVISNTAGLTSGGIGSGVTLSGTAHLTVSYSDIVGNQVIGDPADGNTGFGGGIANTVVLSTTSGTSIITITHSSIHNNSAVNGGGVGASLAGAIGFVDMRTTIEDSAIYSNTASGTGEQRGNGGGIANLDATFILRNSTVSGNRASGGGSQTSGLAGGLLNGSFAIPAQLTVENSTIANNQAIAGGGLTNVKLSASASATTSFRNSIMANNTDLSGFGPNCLNPNLGAGAATLTSNDHNLDSGVTCGFTQSGDRVNADPLLGPLADNGGPTWTHALMDNSPAIDAAGSATCPATDQRGVARPQGQGCDIGAYEAERTTVQYLYLPMTQK